jgi:hypothetical protein
VHTLSWRRGKRKYKFSQLLTDVEAPPPPHIPPQNGGCHLSPRKGKKKKRGELGHENGKVRKKPQANRTSGRGMVLIAPQMIYSWINKEMSSLYFALHVFCLFEARLLGIGDATSRN